jgi:cell division inhibitor SepF
MALAGIWSRTLVYFGIAEEDEGWDEDGYVTNEELERTYSERERANVRRLQPRRRQDFDDWTDSGEDEPEANRPRSLGRIQQQQRPARLQAAPNAGPGPNAQVHLVVPRSFNDAQQIADKFKSGVPVILNLQGADQELSKRLIDFTSGLTYALDGGMQRVADKVFLLTPRNVEVSAEERARLVERGFYNQA